MLIRHLAAAAAALSVLVCVPVVHADPFIAGSLNMTSSEFKNVKSGTGFTLAAGYELPQFPIFVEGEYYTSGQMKVDDDPNFPELDDLKISYRGFLGNIGYAFKLNNSSRVWLKGGYYSLKGKSSADGDSITEKDSGFTLGAGGDWMFSKQIGLRAEIETPFKVKTLPGSDGFVEEKDERSQLSILRIGLVWRPFGGDGTSSSSGGIYGDNPNTPVSEPSYAPPVAEPVAAAPAAAAPAPAPAPASRLLAPFATGSTATVRIGSGIRAQPKIDSALMGSTTVETSVTLAGSTSNAGGQWWYVKGSTISGWVLASDLLTP